MLANSKQLLEGKEAEIEEKLNEMEKIDSEFNKLLKNE